MLWLRNWEMDSFAVILGLYWNKDEHSLMQVDCYSSWARSVFFLCVLQYVCRTGLLTHCNIWCFYQWLKMKSFYFWHLLYERILKSSSLSKINQELCALLNRKAEHPCWRTTLSLLLHVRVLLVIVPNDGMFFICLKCLSFYCVTWSMKT